MNRQLNLFGAVTVVLLVVGLMAAFVLGGAEGGFTATAGYIDAWPCKWW